MGFQLGPSSLYADKRDGLDVQQYQALPEGIRRALVHGTDREFAIAVETIRKSQLPFGDGALEYVADMRSIIESSRR